MHGLTVKKVYFYALSFILLAIMLYMYSMGEIVWRLSEIIIQPPYLTLKTETHVEKQDIPRETFYSAWPVLLMFIFFHH